MLGSKKFVKVKSNCIKIGLINFVDFIWYFQTLQKPFRVEKSLTYKPTLWHFCFFEIDGSGFEATQVSEAASDHQMAPRHFAEQALDTDAP